MNTYDCIILLLRSALTGEQLNMEYRDNISSMLCDHTLFSLAYSHSVANMVSIGLLNNGFNPEGTAFEQAELQAAFSDANMEAMLSSIRAIFEAHHIIFVPLKGLALKQFYPETSMRTCGDVDVLVKEEQLEAAVHILVEECGYKIESYNYHDVLLMTPENIALELHFSVHYDIDKLDKVLGFVWDYAESIVESKYEMKLKDDFFLFFILAHIYHHFVTSGCGVRFFMDLWIIRHRMEIEYENGANKLCEAAGIGKFAENAILLSEVWFGDEEHTELTASMADYVLACGIFGNAENKAVNNSVLKKNDRLTYNLKRMLLPYGKLKLIYPEMKPVQFPVYEVKRWGELLNRRVNRNKEIGEKIISDEKKEKITLLMKQLEIG